MTTCSESGCEGPVHARGRCQAHYRHHMRNGAPGTRCQRPDCERRAEARGLCHAHYRAEHHAGIGGVCHVLDCDNPVRVIEARLCNMHYQRWLTGGDKGRSNRFPGLGVLACRACGEALLTHERWPCPELDRSDLYVRGDVGARWVRA